MFLHSLKLFLNSLFFHNVEYYSSYKFATNIIFNLLEYNIMTLISIYTKSYEVKGLTHFNHKD